MLKKNGKKCRCNSRLIGLCSVHSVRFVESGDNLRNAVDAWKSSLVLHIRSVSSASTQGTSDEAVALRDALRNTVEEPFSLH